MLPGRQQAGAARDRGRALGDDAAHEDNRRSFAARLGVVLLNLLTPGLGLIRVGRLRTGLAFAFGLNLFVLALALVSAVAPRPLPVTFLFVVFCGIAITAFVILGSVIATWRASRDVARPIQWWRRWYALLTIVTIAYVCSIAVVALGHAFYKPFYLPAAAMSPTLEKGDRILAEMGDRRALRRGEIILFAVGEHIYIKRVAALAGNRIAMRGGVPVINGTPAIQRLAGSHMVSGLEGRIFIERLPGEQGGHPVLDMGQTAFDDMPETVVPPDHIFVLGDNRDMSADSRVPRTAGGVEMLPVEDVRGRPLFRTWDEDFRWLGSAID